MPNVSRKVYWIKDNDTWQNQAKRSVNNKKHNYVYIYRLYSLHVGKSTDYSSSCFCLQVPILMNLIKLQLDKNSNTFCFLVCLSIFRIVEFPMNFKIRLYGIWNYYIEWMDTSKLCFLHVKIINDSFLIITLLVGTTPFDTFCFSLGIKSCPYLITLLLYLLSLVVNNSKSLVFRTEYCLNRWQMLYFS